MKQFFGILWTMIKISYEKHINAWKKRWEQFIKTRGNPKIYFLSIIVLLLLWALYFYGFMHFLQKYPENFMFAGIVIFVFGVIGVFLAGISSERHALIKKIQENWANATLKYWERNKHL